METPESPVLPVGKWMRLMSGANGVEKMSGEGAVRNDVWRSADRLIRHKLSLLGGEMAAMGPNSADISSPIESRWMAASTESLEASVSGNLMASKSRGLNEMNGRALSTT
jgi:hypothetical protein